MPTRRTFLVRRAAVGCAAAAVAVAAVAVFGAHDTGEVARRTTTAPPGTTPPPGSGPTSGSVPPRTDSSTTEPDEVLVPGSDPDVATPQETAFADFGPLATNDDGPWCATGHEAADLNAFFAQPHGSLRGADYQRVIRLRDGRALWTFQDAWLGTRLFHNVGLIQSGNCFRLLVGKRSWLQSNATTPMKRWWWIAGAAEQVDGTLGMFVMEMRETSGRYLGKPVPQKMWLVTVDPATLNQVAIRPAPNPGVDLYGWSVTSDREWTYLFSHCHQQFGFGTPTGQGTCAKDLKVARVRRGRLTDQPQYWNGSEWVADARTAVSLLAKGQTRSSVNPGQVMYDGTRFLMVIKEGDWMGSRVVFLTAPHAEGPWRRFGFIRQPLLGDPKVVNSYFTSWLPWPSSSGGFIWAISNNRWDGKASAFYRPTFKTTQKLRVPG